MTDSYQYQLMSQHQRKPICASSIGTVSDRCNLRFCSKICTPYKVVCARGRVIKGEWNDSRTLVNAVYCLSPLLFLMSSGITAFVFSGWFYMYLNICFCIQRTDPGINMEFLIRF